MVVVVVDVRECGVAMVKVTPESCCFERDDHPLVREIKDKLPAEVVHRIHLFYPWIEKRQERDLASKIAAYRKIRAAVAWIAGLLAYPVVAFYIGASFTNYYGIDLVMINILLGTFCVAMVVALYLLCRRHGPL